MLPKEEKQKKILAYIIGVALGDGNLSNPNGRAVRLRISCDIKYPILINKIYKNLQKLFPDNKVSIIKRKKNCCDISCYSNKLENWLGWKAKKGSKFAQKVRIPEWIMKNKKYSIECLRGLIETDGSIYLDRGYKMINFVSIIKNLAKDTFSIIKKLGFKPKIYKIKSRNNYRYNIRISKNVEKFIQIIKPNKS